MLRLAALLTVALALPASVADLDSIKLERNLERRAGKALDYAEDRLKAAQKYYREKGDLKQTNAALEEVRLSVELAYKSLVETGKNPSRRPRHFKRAEIKTRNLLRRLGDFRERMAIDDRETADETRAALEHVQNELLTGIMGRK